MLEAATQIIERCHPSCRACVRQCLTLQELDVNGLGLVQLWQNGANPDVPFSCALCGLCNATCNRKLDLMSVIQVWREEISEQDKETPAIRSPFQTDQPDNLYQYYRANYSSTPLTPDLKLSPTIFFPGCALSSYTPDLAAAAFDFLSQHIPNISRMEGCCFDPLFKLGLSARFEKASEGLKTSLDDLGVERIIVECPNCFYRLKELFPSLKISSIYEIMVELQTVKIQPDGLFAIHDACPDRFNRELGRSVRKLISREAQEMKHELANTICCGAGGELPSFNPRLSQKMANRRLEEAESSGAEMLLTYCVTCAVQLASTSQSIRVQHILDLAFGIDRDYHQIYKRLNKLEASLM